MARSSAETAVQPAIRVGAAPRALAGPTRSLLLLALLVLFTLSGSMLWTAGYNYDGLSGGALTKIHPGTYLTFLTFGLAALADGNPVRCITTVVERRPASFFLLAAAAVVLVQTTYRSAPGMAGFIDTYMLPACLSALILMADRATRDRSEWILHAVMICNALMALVELGTKQLFFPYRFDGEYYPGDTRSTALQGHPLINAVLTMVYILALLAGGGRLSPPVRAGVVFLEAMGLVAFGGRAALVTCTILAAWAGISSAFRALRLGRVSLLAASAAVLVLTIAPLGAGALAVGGFFDAIADRFASDGGSANARVDMLALLERIPFGDLLVGPDPQWVDSLRFSHGLTLGIESPIVKTVVYQGILMTGLLVLAVGWFCVELARASRPGVGLPMLGFLIVINTFESLASKSTLLAKFAVMILILFRPDRHGRPALASTTFSQVSGGGLPGMNAALPSPGAGHGARGLGRPGGWRE